jgi:predicted ATPase/DNA-binding CsgD family transcriptional regulator/transcriptional regulator with XRE-family HTH domain
MAEQTTSGFARLLRQLRIEARLTQDELAKSADVSARSVSDLERGINRTARKDTAVQLAGALGLAEPLRSLFVAAALGRIQAAQVLAARRRQAPGESLASASGIHGFVPALTSFVGRAGPVSEIATLLDRGRMVTVTGPGGAGKTRLAGEVARQVAGRFADGVWLAELAPVRDPALVPAVVATALGVREQPGMPAAGVLTRVLARQQLLLVLDNCEHMIGAAAELCAELLAACDDVRVLATSREPLRVAGEARYRLGPLALSDPDDPADAAESEAVALFADRARQADPRFVLDDQAGPVVARLVTRLDGMPLAIELAAARVEALGVRQLLDRIDDRFALLTQGDRVAAGRQRSLAAMVDWSYQLLDERERGVFRAVSVFPAGFTLEAAEAVAGPEAGPAVLRLVDCSLLSLPQACPDGRSRYGMLETLRAYGNRLLAEAGEQDQAAAALARHALAVAGQAAAGVVTIAGERDAARWLDAEDATMRQVLAWALDRDPAMALRLAITLAPWWMLRDRLAGQYAALRAAADCAEPGGEEWCAAQFWLGWAAFSADPAGALGHFTALRDAVANQPPSPALAHALAGRAQALRGTGRITEAAADARRALAVARDAGHPPGELLALAELSQQAAAAGDHDDAVRLARQAAQITDGINGQLARLRDNVLFNALIGAGDLAAAERFGAVALAQARESGNLQYQGVVLWRIVDVDLRAGRTADAAVHLREFIQLAVRAGFSDGVPATQYHWVTLCVATGRHAEALTMQAAHDAWARREGIPDGFLLASQCEEQLRRARQALGPARARAAEERGAAMSLATWTEYALMLIEDSGPRQRQPQVLGQLSARERELVTLVAQGRTNAQIATQLYISARTVASHLDRIRDKTGCRRRADLTRLALSEGLV